MSKELWIKAEERFFIEFFNKNQRVPTEDETFKQMPAYFQKYMADLTEHSLDFRGDMLSDRNARETGV